MNKLVCVELGLVCVNICRGLDRGTNEKKPDELNQSVYYWMNRLTLWVEPAIYISSFPLKFFQSQDCGRDSEEASPVEQTKCGLSILPREER